MRLNYGNYHDTSIYNISIYIIFNKTSSKFIGT